MSDGVKTDMFRDEYEKAVAAYERGDIAAAKRGFLRAAAISESLAASGDSASAAARLERAKKLRAIAAGLGSSAKTAGREPSFLRIASKDERISFDDIIGLEEAKAAIHRLLIDPLKNPEVYKRYGIEAGGSILLEGPPGTGKTTFAKAAASSLDVPFAEVDSNALVDPYIGNTGKNIDAMFSEARELSKSHGKPVVLFLDEIDYLAQKRGGENKTAAEAVPALIKQMDGFSTGLDGLILIAATNIISSLDSAVISRFRSVINIPLPNEPERQRLFEAKLAGIPGEDLKELDLRAAAMAARCFSGRDITKVALELKNALAARDAGIRSIDVPLGELLFSLISASK